MDPVSAIGLASSIIAFIDFSWELVAGTWEIYRSPDGSLDRYARLEDVIGDLQSLTQPLQAKIPVKSSSETRIERIARRCQEDSQALLTLLTDLKGNVERRTIWTSLNTKWKTILRQKEVAELMSQLEESRAEIHLHMIAMMQ